MSRFENIDLQRACLVPSSVFASPDEVVDAPHLTRGQRLAILRRWEFDARRVVGFGGGADAGALLAQIRRALRTLEVDGPARPEAWDELTTEVGPGFAPGVVADEI